MPTLRRRKSICTAGNRAFLLPGCVIRGKLLKSLNLFCHLEKKMHKHTLSAVVLAVASRM